jgi:ketosteroid isomerase-like protein
MHTRIIAVAALYLLGCFTASAPAQDRSDEATIRSLESKWTDAYKQRQIAPLATMLADDYVITMEDGSTLSKVGFLSHNMGPLRVEVAEMLDLKIRMRENVAVVTGTYHERGTDGGKAYDYHDRLTDVWMKINGKWQLIASHYSLPSKL